MTDTIADRLAQAQQQAIDTSLTGPEIEAAIIDLAATFEARSQHHFKRGPFYKKLRALLIENNQAALAVDIQNYSNAVNVLKHGTGASYRELKAAKSLPFTLKIPAGNIRLVDVTQDSFFAGFVATLDRAHQFLQSR